jgi:hypothetical protein
MKAFSSGPTRALRALFPLALVAASACTDAFPHTGNGERIVVSLESGELGTVDQRLPISLTAPRTFHLTIQAQQKNGATDTTFDRYVRIHVEPGNVAEVRAAAVAGRNVKLAGGLADNVEVDVVGAFGDTRIWAEDVGYSPASTSSAAAPACSDGVDNDGDNLIDFPSDPGCFAANDDTEDAGSYAAGISPTIFFAKPRVSDVQGAQSGGTVPPFKGLEIFLDTGWHAPQPSPTDPNVLTAERFDFNLVVTRISSSGFFATDTDVNSPYRAAAAASARSRDPGFPFSSVYAFTFSAPGGMRVCDRIRTLNGTATDFYGNVQMSSPSYVVEAWDKTKRPCLVPEPFVLLPKDLDKNDLTVLARNKSALVRVITAGDVAVSVSAHFGRNNPAGPDYKPTEDASNCDFDGDGQVEFSATVNAAEAACARACDADAECTEFSNFVARGTFVLVVRQGATARKMQANAFAAPSFKARDLRGKPIKSFSGTLNYFSGGSQYTIEARCDDDAIIDPTAEPKASDVACVRPRSLDDDNENTQ